MRKKDDEMCTHSQVAQVSADCQFHIIIIFFLLLSSYTYFILLSTYFPPVGKMLLADSIE